MHTGGGLCYRLEGLGGGTLYPVTHGQWAVLLGTPDDKDWEGLAWIVRAGVYEGIFVF